MSGKILKKEMPLDLGGGARTHFTLFNFIQGTLGRTQESLVNPGNELASATPAHFASSFPLEMSWRGLPLPPYPSSFLQ